jgi:iron(III) transport system substrate-binding protein
MTKYILSTLALALALAAAPALAQDDGGITVYTSQHQALTQEWADGFTAKTGIPVAIRKGTDILMANQIVQEGLNSPADIFLTENSPAMVMVEQAGLFLPVAPETLAQIPEQFQPASGMWTGIAARTTLFVYNTELLSEAELPVSMLDLARPEWQGRWGAAPAGADFQAIVSALLELRGSEETGNWLAGLKRNALPYRGNFEAMRGANVGEVAGALIYNYYYFGDQAGTGESSDKLKVHSFANQDPGAFVSVSGGGVLKASDNPEAAQAFLAFVTGPEGQAILRDGNSYEYAIGNGIEANPALPPLSGIDYPRIDPSLLNAQEVVQLMTAAGVI